MALMKKLVFSKVLLFLVILFSLNNPVFAKDSMPSQQVVNLATANHGIEVSEVSGHTAFYNAVADFNVVLKSQPTGDVIIPISSSNTNEGIVLNSEIDDITELKFTPDNWNYHQKVIVKGRNRNVVDGKQNYSIILGTAQSIDTNYNGIDPQDVTMVGIPKLSLAVDNLERKYLVGESITIPVAISSIVNDKSKLHYELISAPQKMTLINDGYGYAYIHWTPSEADKDQTYTVTLRVTYEQQVDEKVIQLSVMSETSPLNTTVTDQTLKIIDSSTNLSGMEIELLGTATNTNDIKVTLLNKDIIPADIQKFYPINSDVFRITSSNKSGQLVRIPAEKLQLLTEADWSTHYVYLIRDGHLRPARFIDIAGKKYVQARTNNKGIFYFSIKSKNQINPLKTITPQDLY